MAKKVEEKETTAVATITPPKPSVITKLDEHQLLSVLDDSELAKGDFQQGDVAIPRLRIIQSNSPEAMKGNAKKIEGAESGQFFNTATSALFDGDEGIDVIPVLFRRSVTEWVPRGGDGSTGGGFVADHGTDETLLQPQFWTKNEKGKLILNDTAGPEHKGHEIVNGAEYYMLVLKPDEDPGYEIAVMTLTSTQLKKARSWNAKISALKERHPGTGKMFTPAMFYGVYHLTTIPEANAKGAWMGLKIEFKCKTFELEGQALTGAELYDVASEFRNLINAGKAKAAPMTADAAADAADEPETETGEEAPF